MSAGPTWADIGPRRWPTALFALRSEPRVSWCMHVPASFRDDPGGHQLVVAVHGTGRGAQGFRDAFAACAEAERWVVLAPLFPVGVRGDGDPDGYKRLIEVDLRYDQLLLAMVDELSEVLGVTYDRFSLFGFSGGGHFAHRFFYLHSHRLAAVCVGACGGITRINAERPWPLGTGDLTTLFNAELDLASLRTVPALLLIGGEDDVRLPIPPRLQAELGSYEPTRLGLSQALFDNWRDHGLQVNRLVVPGVAHEGLKLVAEAAAFFAVCGDRAG